MACCCKGEIQRDEKWDLVVQTVDKYKDTEGSLISILQKVQELYNYVPRDAVELISEKTGLKQAKIMGVVTFYTQFRTTPIGKHLIMLCKGTACHVNGAGDIEGVINDELGINDGETTEDGLFTLMNVACLGCCSLSPVMMIGEETFGKLTMDSTKKILKDYKKREEA